MKKLYKWAKARLCNKKFNLVYPLLEAAIGSQDDLPLDVIETVPCDDASDSDPEYLDTSVDKLIKEELRSSKSLASFKSTSSNCQGYVSFVKGLAQTRDLALRIKLPEAYELDRDPYFGGPKVPAIIRNLDYESHNMISELIQARMELKLQGYPTDGSKKKKRRPVKSTLNYRLWPKSQWPNRPRRTVLK